MVRLLRRARPRRVYTMPRDMLVDGPLRYSPANVERVLACIVKQGEHWVWYGGHRDGGQPAVHIGKAITANGKTGFRYTHPARILANLDIPPNMCFVQQCEVTDCVNPTHYAVVHGGIARRMFRRRHPELAPRRQRRAIGQGALMCLEVLDIPIDRAYSPGEKEPTP